MKKLMFLFSVILVFLVEIVSLIIFSLQTPSFPQDTIAVNEIVQSVTQDFNSLENHKNNTNLDYVVLDENGNVLYKTKSGLSENINSAITHRDTILEVVINNSSVGKIIIFNDEIQVLELQRKTTIIVLTVAIVVQCIIFISYVIYMYVTIIRPFRKLKVFAKRVAGGNLDIPLEMDRHNLFGAFTESFDIMRLELKKAHIAEAQANASKKELIAKLSHDIKTPVASIKAVSEVGLEVTNKEKDKANYIQIIRKADQINTLITNLFTATLEELQQLSVIPKDIESKQIKTMLENADYMHRAVIPKIPECLVFADTLRLQQVFDNIFANSYKYANTDIFITFNKIDSHICIIIEDFGGGVKDDELPLLKEKFKRGSNSINTEGAGLGLYISDYFMKEMKGDLKIENGFNGLKVIIYIAISGKN